VVWDGGGLKAVEYVIGEREVGVEVGMICDTVSFCGMMSWFKPIAVDLDKVGES